MISKILEAGLGLGRGKKVPSREATSSRSGVVRVRLHWVLRQWDRWRGVGLEELARRRERCWRGLVRGTRVW